MPCVAHVGAGNRVDPRRASAPAAAFDAGIALPEAVDLNAGPHIVEIFACACASPADRVGGADERVLVLSDVGVDSHGALESRTADPPR